MRKNAWKKSLATWKEHNILVKMEIEQVRPTFRSTLTVHSKVKKNFKTGKSLGIMLLQKLMFLDARWL